MLTCKLESKCCRYTSQFLSIFAFFSLCQEDKIKNQPSTYHQLYTLADFHFKSRSFYELPNNVYGLHQETILIWSRFCMAFASPLFKVRPPTMFNLFPSLRKCQVKRTTFHFNQYVTGKSWDENICGNLEIYIRVGITYTVGRYGYPYFRTQYFSLFYVPTL